VVLNLLLIGLGITLIPFPLTAFVLVLGARKGTLKGLAFILGWLVSVT
jgi:threonine/homoserine/homoserine lactone efflux protein